MEQCYFAIAIASLSATMVLHYFGISRYYHDYIQEEVSHMSKFHETKRELKKLPKKTLQEKRQAKRDKKNMPQPFSISAQ